MLSFCSYIYLEMRSLREATFLRTSLLYCILMSSILNFSSTYFEASFICLDNSYMCLVCSSNRMSTLWKTPVSKTLGSLAIMSVI